MLNDFRPARLPFARSVLTACALLALAGTATFAQPKDAPKPAAKADAKADPKDAAKAAATATEDKADAAARALAEKSGDEQLVKDFIHYVRIDRTDLAGQFAAALLSKVEKPYGTAAAGTGIPLDKFVSLIEGTGETPRFEDAVIRGQRSPTLADTASKLSRAYDAGKLTIARNVDQIQAAIEQLTGTQRQRLIARERLVAAGEYATPLLLKALEKGGDLSKVAEIKQTFIDLGRQAAAPLSVALPGLTPTNQETVATLLGQIPSPVAIPALTELAERAKTDSVRKAASKSLATLTRSAASEGGVAGQYAELARAYAAKRDSLIAFPGDSTQPVWSYTAQTGLVATPVASEVYFHTMAVKVAERALAIDSANIDALTTWLSSNLQRELDTPKDYVHPLFSADAGKRDAMFYAVAAGPEASQRVLARALDSSATPLARKAIAAIEKTAGSSNLTAAVDNRRPLLQALLYPSRRVQAEAALALGSGQPQASFDGAERVVPVLGSLVRDAGSKFAVVLADSKERGDSVAGALKSKGYTVLPVGRTLSDIEGPMNDAPGVDLIVTALPASATSEAIKQIKGTPRIAAAPILAQLSSQGRVDLGSAFEGDPLVRLTGDSATAEQTTEAVRQLVSAGGGDLSGDETQAYQLRALAVLRDLAVAGSPVFSVADATGPLTATLGKAKGEVRVATADALSKIADKRAQVALMDAALTAKDAEQVALLGKVAESARKFGNMLEERQVKSLIEMVNKGSDELALATSSLVGSLALDAGSVTGIILAPAAKAAVK